MMPGQNKILKVFIFHVTVSSFTFHLYPMQPHQSVTIAKVFTPLFTNPSMSLYQSSLAAIYGVHKAYSSLRFIDWTFDGIEQRKKEGEAYLKGITEARKRNDGTPQALSGLR